MDSCGRIRKTKTVKFVKLPIAIPDRMRAYLLGFHLGEKCQRSEPTKLDWIWARQKLGKPLQNYDAVDFATGMKDGCEFVMN